MAPSLRDEDPTLSDRLRSVLEQFPDLVGDSMTLARRLAPALGKAGLLQTAGGPAAAPAASLSPTDPLEAQVLTAIRRHPSGQNPGLAPDVLVHLTGLSGTALARAVSALVQSGALVRDAWLVRLPQADDLVVQTPRIEQASALQHAALDLDQERRAIGDRRAVGERRLYDRRTLP